MDLIPDMRPPPVENSDELSLISSKNFSVGDNSEMNNYQGSDFNSNFSTGPLISGQNLNDNFLPENDISQPPSEINQTVADKP